MATEVQIPNALRSLPNHIIDKIMLMRFANGAIAIIRQRTGEGKFLEGSSANADQYSTSDMPIPLGRLQKSVQTKLTKNELKNKDKYTIFTSKGGNTWILLKGGYREYRKLAGKFNEHVVMSWTGRMMRNLGIIRESDTKDEIGFRDPDIARLAYYHNIAGAGKSKRKHVFFAITEEEKSRLIELAGVDATNNILKALQ